MERDGNAGELVSRIEAIKVSKKQLHNLARSYKVGVEYIQVRGW